MSRLNKQQNDKGILNTLQDEMCDIVYRHLNVLMVSLKKMELEINLDDGIVITFMLDSSDLKTFFVYVKENKNSGRRGMGSINFSNKSLEDVVLNFILSQKDYFNCRPEKYTIWFENLKTKMQSLMDEQKKYEDILDSIRNIPMFSPTREVLIEKREK